MKERFVKVIKRFQNYYSHKHTKNKILEKAFGGDTTIFDFDGIDELLDTIVDMSTIIFSNLSEEVLSDNISWYLFEAVDMDDPVVEDKKSKWVVNSPEILFDMLEYFNKEEIK